LAYFHFNSKTAIPKKRITLTKRKPCKALFHLICKNHESVGLLLLILNKRIRGEIEAESRQEKYIKNELNKEKRTYSDPAVQFRIDPIKIEFG